MKTRLLLTSLCRVSFHIVLFKTQEQPPGLELPVCPAWSGVKAWPIAVEMVHVFCAPADVVFCMQIQTTQEVQHYSVAQQRKSLIRQRENRNGPVENTGGDVFMCLPQHRIPGWT